MPMFILFLIIYYGCTVESSSGILSKEYCRSDFIHSDADARAVITTLFAIRESNANYPKRTEKQERIRNTFNINRSIRKEEKSIGQIYNNKEPKRKSCGSITQRGLQMLLAADWVVNILNLKSENVFGTSVNDSFIPGVKLGFRTYDTCGLENAPISRLIEAYSPSQSCMSNVTTIHAGAIVDELDNEDLLDAAAYLKRYSQPILTQSSLPTVLTDNSRYGNVFSTSPSVATKAEAMAQVARQLGWTHVSVVFEDSDYGDDGKRRLLNVSNDHDLCILNLYRIPTISTDPTTNRLKIRNQLDAVLSQLVTNLPHAPVVFVFASELTTVELLQASANYTNSGQTSQLRWLLSDFMKASPRFSGMFHAKGLFALAPDSPQDIPEFRDYWRNIDVTQSTYAWILEFYQESLGCRLEDGVSSDLASLAACPDSASFTLGDVDPDIVITPEIVSVIDGVYTIAVALRRAWETKCRGRPGMCTKLLKMTHEEFLALLRDTEFQFDATLRSPPSLYGRRINLRPSTSGSLAVYELVDNEDQLMFMEIFTFHDDRLHITGQPVFYQTNGTVSTSVPVSTCQNDHNSPTVCSCSNYQPEEQAQPIYKPGDVLLVGVFPIHSLSNDRAGFGSTCGSIRQRDGYQLAEAFWYALQKVNDKRSGPFATVLRGIQVGSVSFDSCNSPLRASYLASGLILNASFIRTEEDQSMANSRFKNRDILGLIGDFGDQTTGELGSLLRFAGLAQLSYGARSADLGDVSSYPTLLRTIVSDNTRLNVTFNALRQVGWDYVQVVSSESSYGRSMSKIFQQESIQRGGCVAQNLVLHTDASNAAAVVEGLFKKQANVVILFVEKKGLRTFLEHLQRAYEFAMGSRRFVLIAADHWYNDPELVKGVELAAEGALTFAARRLSNQHFQKFINTRTITSSEGNPWLVDYIESSLNCNFPGSGTRHYSASCNPASTIGQIPRFRVDLSANDVINAVYAFALGLDAMLKAHCGKNYQGLCTAFRTLPNRNSLLLDYIRRTTFEDETGRMFGFSNQRDAATPVAILHLRKNPGASGGIQYIQAGLYSALDISQKQPFLQPATIRALHNQASSTCASSSNCMECRRFLQKDNSGNGISAFPTSAPLTASSPSKANRNRSDRNSLDPETSSYQKKFLYSPSSDKIVIGAVFPLHGRTGTLSPFQCGELTEEGVLMAEAFLWALDALNANSDVFSFQPGPFVMDSCSDTGQVYNDVKDLYTKPVGYFITNGTEAVDSDDIVAIINDPSDYSSVSLSAGLLSALNVTNFGVGPIAAAFSDDPVAYPYSLHMSSPLAVQTQAILAFMDTMNWTYVSVVHSGRRWGVDAYLRFKSEALDRGFCMGAVVDIRGQDSSAQFDRAVATLKSKIWTSPEEGFTGARVVVLILDKEEASHFLRAVARSMANGERTQAGQLVFIGAASWGDRIPFGKGEEQAALGSIVFQHDSQPVDAFRNYLETLKYDNDRNPWWKGYWRKKFDCGNDEESCRKYSLNGNNVQNEALYTNIMNAVWAASVGLNSLCNSTSKRRQQTAPCRGIQKSKNFRHRFYESVSGSGFNRVDNPQESFGFTKDGWSQSGFYLLNLLRDEQGGLEYKAVGRYSEKTGLVMSETVYGYGKNFDLVALGEVKSECTDIKMCSECATRRRKMIDGFDLATSASTFDLTSPSAPPRPAPLSSQPTSAVIPAYGVHLSNATYTDAFLYAPGSADSFLIAVTFPVHARGTRPLSCGRLRPEHYQNLQAFLWALKIIHADDELLPNAKLGALVFDTCSDSTKAVRDLSNFLSEQVVFRTANGEKIDPNRTLAVLNSPYTEEALPIVELLSSYEIPNISPGLSASMLTLADTYKAGKALRTSVPTNVQARAMVSLLTRIGWDAVSVLFTDNVWGLNGQTDFRKEAEREGVCIVLSESIPESKESDCSDFSPKIDETIGRLVAAKGSANVRGVVAWLTEESLHCFLLGLKKAIDQGSIKSGDFNLILPADVADLYASLIDEFEREAVGLVAFQYSAKIVDAFKEYWQTLPSSDDVAGHFWSIEYHGGNAQGSKSYRQNAYLLNTINAVFSIAVGLEQLRRNVCTGGEAGTLCQKLIRDAQFKTLLMDAIRKVEFEDVTGQPFQFVHDSFGNEGLTISNLVRKDKGIELRQIGSYEGEQLKMRIAPQGYDQVRQTPFNLRDQRPTCYRKESQVCSMCTTRKAHTAPMIAEPGENSLASTAPLTTTDPYTGEQTIPNSTLVAESPVPLESPEPSQPVAESPVPSLPPLAPSGNTRLTKDVLIVPASRRFTIVGLFPVHKQGATLLQCQGFNAFTGFQRLAAFLYAVNEVNKDPYILPGIELGAVAVDYCGSQERALANLFEILSPPEGPVDSEDVVAAIGFDHTGGVEEETDRFFRRLHVPVINSGSTPFSMRDAELTLGTVPADDVYARTVMEIFRQMQWTYFSVLYEITTAFQPTAKYFETALVAGGAACLARSIGLRSDATLEEAQGAVRQLVAANGSNTVAIFLSDINVLQTLKAVVAERVPAGRFVFVTKFNDDWTTDIDFLEPLQRFGQGLLTIELQRRNATNFFHYLSSLTLRNHTPFPTNWFEEFWQESFQCVLQDSSSVSQQFSTACTGNERLVSENFIQGGSVLPTILAVHAAARGLHRFLIEQCPSQMVDSLEACMAASPNSATVSDSRTQLMKAIRAANFSYAYDTQKEPVYVNFGTSQFLDAEYLVRNLVREADGNFQAQEVGTWKPSTGLTLDYSQVILYDSHGEKKTPTSICVGDQCSAQCSNDPLGSDASHIYANSPPESKEPAGPGPLASLYFNSVWGIVVAAVAALGMLTCVVCIIYFSVTFPISHGTTILGYMILFGLIVLYALAFAYVVAPTPVSCSIRRFCTGVCWAFVFAPMLVKVAYAWHMRAAIMKPPARLDNHSSPCSLFGLALGVASVQVVIAVEWMILQAPDGVVYLTWFRGAPLTTATGGVWRCSPGESFEMFIIISSVYVMLLLFLTTIFSLLTWNADEQNRESRWIFLATAISIAVWITWTILSTRLEYKLRDPAIAIGIVVDATVILLCLYLRKAYLYSKYRREAKEVMFDNQSAVYLTSTLASGGQIMLDTSSFYDGKLLPAAVNGIRSSPSISHMPVPSSRRHCLPVATPSTPADVNLNGRRLTVEGKAIFYSNAAYDDACEFTTINRNGGQNGAVSLYNGRTNGSITPSSPTNHRF